MARIERRTPTRTDATGATMTERLFVTGPGRPITLLDLIAALDDAGAHNGVEVHGASMSWTRPATPEEREEWAERGRRDEERREAWERDEYRRLREKYG